MAAGTFLIGGGWDPAISRELYPAFLDAAGPGPVIACVVVDEGEGAQQYDRFAAALTTAGACRPVPVLVPLGRPLTPGRLPDADGLLVCGGLTPAYAQALQPSAAELRDWLRDRPYCGFSAGAAVAATRAVVGGWRHDGLQVCPEDAGEDLDQVTVVEGLGLVPYAVDVHCAQWGTLPRLLTAVASSPLPGRAVAGVGLDEGTMLTERDGSTQVSGSGNAWVVRADGTVTPVAGGGRF